MPGNTVSHRTQNGSLAPSSLAVLEATAVMRATRTRRETVETTLEVAVRRARTAIAAAQVAKAAGMMRAKTREVKAQETKSATKRAKAVM